MKTVDFQPGCVLQMGKEALCFSSDPRPLLYNKKENNEDHYFCPLLSKVIISIETYKEIENLVESVLLIQDNEEICMNLWPMVSGIARMKDKASTVKGKEIQSLSQKVRDELEEIVLNIS
ncbi:MAG: hypothetical protein ACFE9L_14140 [Candidatus Hodarchaeota archaeon]